MIEAPKPVNESERLAKLRSYRVLDTEAEQLFDDLTHLASQICGSRISLVSLVDEDRQWFKSRVGLEAVETPREYAFCAHAIHGEELFYVPDATKDERFFDNPLVTGDPNVKFYAGAPIVTPDGHRLGSLCVIDDYPRGLTEAQKGALLRLSRQVTTNLELRRRASELEAVNQVTEAKNEELQQFAYRTSHDLKAPITSTKRLAENLIEDIDNHDLHAAVDGGKKIKLLMENLETLVSDIVSLVRADVSTDDVESIDASVLLNESCERLKLFADQNDCRIQTKNQCTMDLNIERGRMSQIVDNLISNGIKYKDNNKTENYVSVSIFNTSTTIGITVEDNGIGIPEKFQPKMFDMFKRFHSDSFGSGLGLAIVKKHVDRLQGSIACSSSEKGTTFNISIPMGLHREQL